MFFTTELASPEMLQRLGLEGEFYHMTFLPDLEIDTRLLSLQAKDFIKWLRKLIRQGGRKAQLCDQRNTPVEIWVKDVTGIDITFIAGGEVQVAGQTLHTEWTSISYYMFQEDGMMVVEAGKMLDAALLEQPEAHLIAQA
jgi:hypothetical protein